MPVEWLPDLVAPTKQITYPSSEEASPQEYSPPYKYENDSAMLGVHTSEGSYDAFDSDENILGPLDT